MNLNKLMCMCVCLCGYCAIAGWTTFWQNVKICKWMRRSSFNFKFCEYVLRGERDVIKFTFTFCVNVLILQNHRNKFVCVVSENICKEATHTTRDLNLLLFFLNGRHAQSKEFWQNLRSRTFKNCILFFFCL